MWIVARPIGLGTKRVSGTLEQAFGWTLTDLRIEKRISQEELAHSLGYHLSYIGQLERGLKSPTLRTLFNIAQMFEISLSALLRRTEKNLKHKS